METFSYINEHDLAKKFTSLVEAIKKDPIENFFKHGWFLNFIPTPAQTIALKCIFQQKLDPITLITVSEEFEDENGLFDLADVEMTEVELYRLMTGREYKESDYIGQGVYVNKINLIVGRRGGKTTISAMLSIYCAIIADWNIFLSKTPFATVLILSHSKEFSDEVLDLVRKLIQDSPILRILINKEKKNTASTMNLKMPFLVKNKISYSRVQIKVGAASSRTTRGIAACAVLCDEIAYWNLDEKLKETDSKILTAVRPAMKQFGKHGLLIKLSSPGIKQGVLHEEYEKWEDKKLPKTYVVFKAPSWVWNDILPKQEYVEEWFLDQEGFNTEYRANFVDSLSDFLNPEFVDLATMGGVDFNPPELKKVAVNYRASIDAAFKNDKFTFSIVGHFENRIKQYVIKGFEGTRKNPVKAFEVAKYCSTMCKEFGIAQISADQYAFEPLREIFEQFGLTLTEKPFSLTYKKKIYFNLKRLVNSQQIDLLDNKHMIKEMKELIVEQTNGGQIRIGHPNGGSDDYADCTAMAAFEAVESGGVMGFTFEHANIIKDYGIKLDTKGRAFTAPSPEMLNDVYQGSSIIDNSDLYTRDEETGKLIKIEDFEDVELDVGPHFTF